MALIFLTKWNHYDAIVVFDIQVSKDKLDLKILKKITNCLNIFAKHLLKLTHSTVKITS